MAMTARIANIADIAEVVHCLQIRSYTVIA
jgi:hypothetical protein